jgi:hypothetical protein
LTRGNRTGDYRSGSGTAEHRCRKIGIRPNHQLSTVSAPCAAISIISFCERCAKNLSVVTNRPRNFPKIFDDISPACRSLRGKTPGVIAARSSFGEIELPSAPARFCCWIYWEGSSRLFLALSTANPNAANPDQVILSKRFLTTVCEAVVNALIPRYLKSGRRLPHSKSWRTFAAAPKFAKRLGVRQPSGALAQRSGNTPTLQRL